MGNWKGQSTKRPAVIDITGEGKGRRASTIHGQNRDAADDGGIYVLKLGYIAISVDWSSHHKFRASLISIGKGALTQSLKNDGDVNLDHDRLGLWGFSAGAGRVTGIAIEDAAKKQIPALKAVVAIGQVKKHFGGLPLTPLTNQPPPWFFMWCSEGPLTGRYRRPWSNIGRLEKLNIPYTSFHWWNCFHGQYNKNDEEWWPQIQEYFAQTLGRVS